MGFSAAGGADAVMEDADRLVGRVRWEVIGVIGIRAARRVYISVIRCGISGPSAGGIG
jgi:hypothetical protein